MIFPFFAITVLEHLLHTTIICHSTVLTVNLMIPPSDFIEYIEHLDKYSIEMDFEDISGAKEWPEGLLNKQYTYKLCSL